MNLSRTSSHKSFYKSVIVYFLTFCMFFNTSLPVVLAGPEGAQVVNGDVSIQQSGYNTTITASDRAIINYSSFDISRPEIVQFIQPGTSASVLNRILSANPTNINGTLLANGRVFFVNRAGVYFGHGAQVNANQLVASALDMTNADFINGRYNFAGGEGSVINEGDISAEQVYLIGRQVANFGSISCPGGYVVMAAGDRVFLGEPGSDIVLEIDATSSESGDPIEGSGVLNEGTVEAAGGKIVLAAAGDIYSQAISNVGSLSVSAQTGDGGQVELTAAGGQITNSGTIDASGDNGGSVTIDGGDVTLSGDSAIHADGTNKGGMVEILADTLVADGIITASGPQGAYGYILLDPAELTIDDILAGNIVTALLGADYHVVASDTIIVDGEIDSSAQSSTTTLSFDDEDTNNDLTINLNDKIMLGSNQTLTGDGTVINVASTGLIQNGIDVAATTTSATVTVSNGTYTEDLTVDKSNLTLKSVNGRDNTTIQLVDGVGIDIGSGGSGFVLGGGASDGFEITSSGATTFNVQLKNAPSNVEISWNSFDTTNNSDNQGISVGAAGATGLNITNNTFKTDDVPGVGGVVWGDGSIWGPDMVDVSVTNNTFTGPAVHAASGYAVEFAGVTGTSLIQDNIISNYGMGIAIFNGTGTSGLTISGNQISDSTNGIRLGQYSPGVNGDMTTVTVTENTLSNNTIGLRINNGANVKASNFTIRNNSFLGNTTGLANQHTSESVTAEQNYWGHEDGPSGIGPGSGDPITEAVADSVDYSPWWGGDYIGDAHATSWIWGTDDFIQDAIDLASTTVSDTINVVTGSYAEDVTVNKDLTLSVPSGTATMTSLTSNGGTTTGLSGLFSASAVADPAFQFNGAVMLAGDVTLTSTNNRAITFNSTVDGGQALVVNTSGVTTFDGALGSSIGDELVSLTTDAGGRTEIGAGTINLDGASATFNDAVLLTDNLTINEAGSGNIEFASTVDSEVGSNYTLTVNSGAGTTIFGDAVGSDALGADSQDDGLGSITTNAAGTTELSANVTTSGAQTYNDDVTVADSVTLKAGTNLEVAGGKTLTANGDLTVEATGGAITAGLITMQADNKTLTLTQNDAIDMADFSVTNDEDTDLVANSTDGSITSMTADSWQSITAEAKDNIELSGTGDIKIDATGLLSHDGGVKVVSSGGSIYTPGAGDTLNSPITGYSDESVDIGVDLIYPYWPEYGKKAAIVIWSPYEDLKLGPDATLTAKGTYDPAQFDDRRSFLYDFGTAPELRGDEVDVAIYLGSSYSGNVDMGSGSVWIDYKSLSEIGTLVIDAYDTVTFTDAFENSLPGSTVRWLEVVSRMSPDLDTVIAFQRLPYAENPSQLADGLYLGTYVLRGNEWWTNQVLQKREEAAIVPPKLQEPEEQEEVEEPDMEALRALLIELGIGVQPHLSKAYPPSLNTDMRLFKAAEKLQKLIPTLEDAQGRRIAALRVVVGRFFSTLASISDEQMDSFRQELAQHVGDETDYGLARQSISALVEYVEVLSTDIGWPMDKSMGFVMGRYIQRLTEGDAIRSAVVQMQLQEAFGI